MVANRRSGQRYVVLSEETSNGLPPDRNRLLEFAEGRGTLKADFETFKREHMSSGVDGHGSWPGFFVAKSGLSAEDKAAWLHFQRNGAWISPGDYIPADRIRLAA